MLLIERGNSNTSGEIDMIFLANDLKIETLIGNAKEFFVHELIPQRIIRPSFIRQGPHKTNRKTDATKQDDTIPTTTSATTTTTRLSLLYNIPTITPV